MFFIWRYEHILQHLLSNLSSSNGSTFWFSERYLYLIKFIYPLRRVIPISVNCIKLILHADDNALWFFQLALKTSSTMIDLHYRLHNGSYNSRILCLSIEFRLRHASRSSLQYSDRVWCYILLYGDAMYSVSPCGTGILRIWICHATLFCTFAGRGGLVLRINLLHKDKHRSQKQHLWFGALMTQIGLQSSPFLEKQTKRVCVSLCSRYFPGSHQKIELTISC